MTRAQPHAMPGAAPHDLAQAFAAADTSAIAHAIGQAARTHGMTEVARAAGMSRQAAYKTLSATGNPTLATLIRVLGVLGLALSVTRASGDSSTSSADLIG